MNKPANPQILHVKDLTLNATNELDLNGFKLGLYHGESDPENAHRVRIRSRETELEFLPSKGLSLAQAWIGSQQIFWEAPVDLCDTESLDLWSSEISINGHPAPGFTFLKTLMAGLEFYGLSNWGMPVTRNGKMELLHGETSNIPVDAISFGTENEEKCWIQASFLYRNFDGDMNQPWYERGTPIFKVTRKYTLPANGLEFSLEDTIENVSPEIRRPDWGYHITLRPEEGAKLLVPSKKVQERGGHAVPADIETWHRAADPSVRTETGIIHQGLQQNPAETGPDTIVSVCVYPDHTGLAVSVPPSPYFQTWFCNGGKGSTEFTDSHGASILMNNWDGMGLEIGSSALDHNGNIDRTVDYEPDLKPGCSMTIPIQIKWLDKKETRDLAGVIGNYNKLR